MPRALTLTSLRAVGPSAVNGGGKNYSFTAVPLAVTISMVPWLTVS